jgi:hypothetical protein
MLYEQIVCYNGRVTKSIMIMNNAKKTQLLARYQNFTRYPILTV